MFARLPFIVGLISLTTPLFSVYAQADETNPIGINAASQLNIKATSQQNIVTNKLKEQETAVKAQEWGLTKEEWTRYQELNNGERGIWSPGLDPLTVLGIEAKTEQERQYYARLLAKKMYERVEKELAFQRAYDKAFAELYPGELPFEVEPHISQRVGRVIYFTKLNDCEKCDLDATKMLSYVNNRTPVDIYFVGSQTDDAIRQWAQKHNIDPVKVKQRLITLNHDTGKWLLYAEGKMPSAFQVQGDGEWQRLVY